MVTIISRILHYGFNNFRRNGWLSTTTVIIMVLSLLVFIGLILFNVLTDRAVATVQDKIDISVYFKPATPEDQILSVKQALESLSEVKNVNYISSDQALENFKLVHKDDETITQAVNELEENPLEPSLSIKAQQPNQYAMIAQRLGDPNLAALIDKVSYAENQKVIDSLTAIINNVNRGGFALTVIMALIAGLVVFNTVRLAIYSNRDEIGIMRAVGASNSLVRGPYVVEGVIAGIIAAVASIVVAAPVVYAISPFFRASIEGFDIFRYFFANILVLIGYQILFGILIGGLSSFIAVRRYLKN